MTPDQLSMLIAIAAGLLGLYLVAEPWLLDRREQRMTIRYRRSDAESKADFLRLTRTMDNLGRHKGEAVRKAIRSVGAKLLSLPPYSPT